MTHIVYEKTECIDHVLRPMVEKAACMLPPWLHRLIVSVDEGGMLEDEDAAVQVNYTYRWARVCIGGPWITRPPVDQWETILHEFVHISAHPAADAARRAICGLPDRMQAMHDGDFQRALESTVEDLANRLVDLLGPPPPPLPRARINLSLLHI